MPADQVRLLAYALISETGLTKIVECRARDLALKALSRVSDSMALEDQQVDCDLEKRVQIYNGVALPDRNL